MDPTDEDRPLTDEQLQEYKARCDLTPIEERLIAEVERLRPKATHA